MDWFKGHLLEPIETRNFLNLEFSVRGWDRTNMEPTLVEHGRSGNSSSGDPTGKNTQLGYLTYGSRQDDLR